MKMDKKTLLSMIFLAGIILTLFTITAFSRSSPQLTSPGSSFSYLKSQGINTFPAFNPEMCNAGQDFVLQIAPFGCTPAVVRSDLLEEQDVPVFCQISATKINPLIDVNAINRMIFKNWPDGVIDVAYQ